LQETTDYLHSKYFLLKLSRISKDFEYTLLNFVQYNAYSKF